MSAAMPLGLPLASLKSIGAQFGSWPARMTG